MESTKSSVQMARAWAEIPHWQLTYIQCHCYMNLFGCAQKETMFHILSHCHKALPSLSTYGSRWTEIPYYVVLGHTSTLDILPQIAVNKQWHYIGVCLYTKHTTNAVQWITPRYTDHNAQLKPYRPHTAFHPPSPGIAVQKDDVNLRTSTVTHCHNPHESHIIF
jgi:hypothetical protein